MFVDAQDDPPFKISLAQWSFHKALKAGQLDHLDFAKVARTEFDIDAVEYVNTFFKDKATNRAYLAEMNRRAKDQGVFQHLIMIDVEGRLGDPDAALRKQAVENHKKWVDAARTLGCITIRVNAESEGTPAEQQKLCADGLRRLTEYGASHEHQRDRRESRRPLDPRRLAGRRHQAGESSPLRHPPRSREFPRLRPLQGSRGDDALRQGGERQDLRLRRSRRRDHHRLPAHDADRPGRRVTTPGWASSSRETG